MTTTTNTDGALAAIEKKIDRYSDDCYSDGKAGHSVPSEQSIKSREALSSAIAAALAALTEVLEAKNNSLLADAERLNFIERTFSGMTNRERYLPVKMVWGRGANGRTLREACDKYMQKAVTEHYNTDSRLDGEEETHA